jgi:hypothetical protein
VDLDGSSDEFHGEEEGSGEFSGSIWSKKFVGGLSWVVTTCCVVNNFCHLG